MPKVKIRVDRFGNPTVLDVDGAGTNCIAATKDLERMLGQAADNQRVLTENYVDLEADPQTLTHEGE